MSGEHEAGRAGGRLRIDKWLWAARFFKTRSLAAQAIEGGKVRLNGERPKVGKELRIGDELTVRIGPDEWVIRVRALSDRRGPAEQARQLYEEDEANRARRVAVMETRRLVRGPERVEAGRPTKRDRRLIRRFTGE